MLQSFRAYDWDYMKVNPRASYHVEDWGARLERSQDPNHGHKFVAVPVREPADWSRLRPLKPTAPVLAEQLFSAQADSRGTCG